MSTITKEEVIKTAFLARIFPKGEFPEEKLAKFTHNLSKVIENAQELNSVNTNGVDFKTGWRTISIEELREDEPTKNIIKYNRTRDNIINNFPLTIENMCAVEGVFNNN